MGVQLGKLGHETPGMEASIYLEKVALQVMGYLGDKKQHSLIIHTEDEFDPINRIGLISLKVLVKAAGLGWQGRSLLIISPDYGPIHRLIAILTDRHLQPDEPIANKCGNCSICIHECPTNALRLARFEDHPKNREHVLNLHDCLGDKGCKVCLIACPWQKNTYRNDHLQERSLG
jgi:epoxyqueuosine reductase